MYGVNMSYYILYSKTGHEAATIQHIKKHLRDEKCRIDFAIMKKEMINLQKGAKITKTYNALPGYIFVRTENKLDNDILRKMLDADNTYFFLHYADGTLELHRDDERFATGVFELPKVITSDNVFIKGGDQVEIVAGAFTALKGKVIRIDRRRSRVDVSLMFMEREMKLSLPFTDVAVRNDEKNESAD